MCVPVPYAWDEPTLDHYLTLTVPSGTTATYNLDQIGEGEQLWYQSYFFITATATFGRCVKVDCNLSLQWWRILKIKRAKVLRNQF